jgi:hypothetical protein
MDVMLLHSNHPDVSIAHAAIFRVGRTTIRYSCNVSGTLHSWKLYNIRLKFAVEIAKVSTSIKYCKIKRNVEWSCVKWCEQKVKLCEVMWTEGEVVWSDVNRRWSCVKWCEQKVKLCEVMWTEGEVLWSDENRRWKLCEVMWTEGEVVWSDVNRR